MYHFLQKQNKKDFLPFLFQVERIFIFTQVFNGKKTFKDIKKFSASILEPKKSLQSSNFDHQNQDLEYNPIFFQKPDKKKNVSAGVEVNPNIFSENFLILVDDFFFAF